MGWEDDANMNWSLHGKVESQQEDKKEKQSPQPERKLYKLRGVIRNLRVTRSSASFVFTESDQTKLGILAIACAMAGLDGQAATASHYASDMEESADYLEFEMGGQPIKGWVWRNPFKEGDAVYVAAEKAEDHWEAFGIARPADRTVALYPHCSRGRATHYKNAVKWWVLGGGTVVMLLLLPLMLFIAGREFFRQTELWITPVIGFAFIGLMTFSLTRQWLPFVCVAEKVFRALELPNPANIDLVKSSKRQRRPDDPGEFGTFYFRY